MNSKAEQRPAMDEFENTLWIVLQKVDPDRAAGLQIQLDYLDGAADSGGSGWPYLEERLREMRKFYAQ